MPIYHVHISSGSRADGQSAAVKVAYILREGAYGGRDDLVCWGSGCMPSWAAADPRQLFEAADLYERSNGRLFLHVWVALPNELTAAERHELGLAIAAALTAAGLPFVYAVHAGDPKSPGEPANPHIHIVISERINDNIPRDARQWFRRANPRDPARGGAAKDRRLKEVTWVDDSRRVVARLTNEHLKVAGCKARVTADSHEVRIVEAEAWGDTETADVLRRHPPGVHLGPAAAAIERDRSGGKRDEAPKVLRQGEPTERGDLARAKAAEEDRVRGELERVSAKLRRARDEEVRATESVASARSAGVSDDRILAVYEESESTAEGSGWAAVEEAASSKSGRKKKAEAAAALLGIDVESVVRVALDEDADPVVALEAAVASFEAARSALLSDEAIEGIRCEAESGELGSGWAAVAEAARRRLAWKARAEPAAREAGIADVEVVYAAALSRGEDPLAALESVTAARLERKKQAENAAGETGIIDIETEYGRARDVGEDPLSMLERATNVVVAARAALVTDETIQAQHAAAESRERGSGWRAVEKASQTRSAWKGRAEASARAAGIVDVEAVYAAALSRGEDPLAALESVTAARLERKKQAENAAGETGIIDIETEYGRARDVGEDPLSMLERATNVVVAARAALVTDETIQAQHAAAESRERGSGWRAVEKASQTRSAWKGRAEASARAAGIADVEAVYAAALSRGEDPLAALEAATAARQAAARRRAAVEGREAVIRATRVGADWLLEAEQRVLRAADRRPTLEEREGIAETVERRIREHLDSRLEALAVTDAGAELLEEMQADASAATLAAQERVIELAAQRLKEHLAEQQRLFAQPVGEDLFTAHLAARDPAWRPGGRTTAENRTAALRAAEAEGARRARARDVFGNRWSRRHYRSAAGALGERFTLADVDAALTAAESFAGRVAGLSEGTGLAVLTEAVAAGGELTVADLEAAVERAEQAERQAARREALSAGGRELYAVRLAALAAADQRAGETPSGAVVDQALDETESDEARLPRLDALFEDAELRSYYRGTLGPARDQHQVTLEQLDEALRAAEAVRARRNTVLQYPGGDQHLSGAALWAAERKSLSPDEGAAVETPLAAFEAALARVESRLEKRVQQAADEVERLLPTTQPYSHGRPDFRVPALGDERLEELGQLRLEPADALVEATVAELRERYARRARYDTPDKLRYSPQDRLKSEGEHLGGVVEMRYDRELRLWSPSSTSPQPSRSSALARVVKKYVLEIWQIVLVACDKILGGDLWERLRRRREQIEKAADVAERLLPTILIFRASPVPVAGDAGLAGVVTDTTAPVVGDAVEVVWARYYRRSLLETPSERRYSAVERDLAAKEYLAFSLEVAEARQQREGSSVLPTLDDARAIVLLEHESNLREMFAVACDEVFGPGELATRWRRRRDRVRDAVDVVEAGLQTTGVGWPDRDVPALSHETLIALAAAEADPHRRAMWRELGERYRRCAGHGTPYEHRYSADDRTEAERAYLAVAFKMAQGRPWRGWGAALPPPAPTPASVLEEHRSNLLEIFAVACEEVSGAGELGERRRPRRDEVRRAVDAAEAALPTTQPHPGVRRDRRVPALSHATWDALFDVETDPFRKAMWRELGERYHRLAGSNTPYDQYYNAEDRKQSEQAHLNEVSTKKYERQLQTWRSSTRESARPTLADAEASVLKDHQAEISGIFTTARDKVLRADEVRARRQEEPDRPVGTSKAARGDAVPASEGSSAGSLQPKAEIAGARQAQASSREEKPAPAAAEPPTPDVVELVAKDSEQNVLPKSERERVAAKPVAAAAVDEPAAAPPPELEAELEAEPALTPAGGRAAMQARAWLHDEQPEGIPLTDASLRRAAERLRRAGDDVGLVGATVLERTAVLRDADARAKAKEAERSMTAAAEAALIDALIDTVRTLCRAALHQTGPASPPVRPTAATTPPKTIDVAGDDQAR